MLKTLNDVVVEDGNFLLMPSPLDVEFLEDRLHFVYFQNTGSRKVGEFSLWQELFVSLKLYGIIGKKPLLVLSLFLME